MNTAIATSGNPERSFNGMGFAIPADMIQEVVEDLIDDGKVVRGYLGAVIEELTPDKAYTFGFDGPGILVVQPQEGFPAAEAGVRPDDIITKIDGEPVKTVKALQNFVKRCDPGTPISLEIFRGQSPETPGETLTIVVEVASRPNDPFRATQSGRMQDGNAEDKALDRTEETLVQLGLSAVTTSRGTRMGMPEGVIIMEIRPGSAAHAARLRRGDVITAVFGVRITSRRDLLSELGQYDATRTIRLRVLTEGRDERSVFLRLPDADEEENSQ